MIKGYVGELTTSSSGRGVALGLLTLLTVKAQFAEQIFEGEIGQIGTELVPFWIGVFAQRGGNQMVDKIGTIYGTYAGIATGVNDVRSSIQEIKSVDKIIVKNSEAVVLSSLPMVLRIGHRWAIGISMGHKLSVLLIQFLLILNQDKQLQFTIKGGKQTIRSPFFIQRR